MKNVIKFNHRPDYSLQRKLFNHQDDLFECYSKLMMLRIDFAYRKESESFEYADIHQITSEMTLLIEQVKDISGIVGFAWVLEYGEQHRLHIHAAFYINGQRHQYIWPFWEDIRDQWEAMTYGEGYAHCGEPVTLHKTQMESWFTHSATQTAEHCPLVTSKRKRLEDKARLSIHVRSVSPILKVTDWFCVQCRDYFTCNQKCCPNCHEGVWCIPAQNVTEAHQPKTER